MWVFVQSDIGVEMVSVVIVSGACSLLHPDTRAVSLDALWRHSEALLMIVQETSVSHREKAAGLFCLARVTYCPCVDVKHVLL